MIGCISTFPFTAIGLSIILCIPNIADWGGLIIGVDSIDPNTPPLVIVKVPPVISSTVISPSLALMASLFISFSTPEKVNFWASLTTGTINPFGPETAILISKKSYFICWSPSIILLTSGNSFSAWTVALVKKLIKPRPTSCFSLNSSLYFFRSSKIGVIFTSLKVVSIAVWFFTATNLCATFLLKSESFLDSIFLPFTIASTSTFGSALSASSLVIRPPLPDPETLDADIFFSLNIFAAAGEGDPLAKLLSSTLVSGWTIFFSIVFSTTFSVGFILSEVGAFAEVSIKHTTAPTSTASPSFALKVMTPLSSAGRSNVALSESNSAIVWSFST